MGGEGKQMTFEEKVEGALDIFHDYWDRHPLEPHWHHAIRRF